MWVRTTGHRDSHKYNQSHDIILFYSTDQATILLGYLSIFLMMRNTLREISAILTPKLEENSWLITCSRAGTRNGESGKEWHGINPTNNRKSLAIHRSDVRSL